MTGILDWKLASIANPIYDLGYFFDRAEALLTWDSLIEAYVAAGGRRPVKAQADYSILLAAAHMGVMATHVTTPASNAREPSLSFAGLIAANARERFFDRVAAALERVL